MTQNFYPETTFEFSSKDDDHRVHPSRGIPNATFAFERGVEHSFISRFAYDIHGSLYNVIDLYGIKQLRRKNAFIVIHKRDLVIYGGGSDHVQRYGRPVDEIVYPTFDAARDAANMLADAVTPEDCEAWTRATFPDHFTTVEESRARTRALQQI